jgi:hypothetical protein
MKQKKFETGVGITGGMSLLITCFVLLIKSLASGICGRYYLKTGPPF